MNRNFLKKKGGGGGSFGTISKSTVVLFCYSIREGGGWVVIFRNFEKSAYVPSKKYLHPPVLRLTCESACERESPPFTLSVTVLYSIVTSSSRCLHCGTTGACMVTVERGIA